MTEAFCIANKRKGKNKRSAIKHMWRSDFNIPEQNHSPIIYAIPKGAVEIDYILALSLFLVFFALTVQYVTDYFATVRESAAVATARSEAINLLGIADRAPEPAGWPQISNVTNDLVLLMHFNNNTLDYSGKGNNGTALLGTNCSASVVGRFYSGCSFDGVNDYVDAGSDASVKPDAFSIAFWVKMTTTSGVNPAVGWSTGTTPNIYMSWGGGLPARPLVYMGVGNYKDFSNTTSSGASLYDGNWHHVVFTMPGSGQTDVENSKMYVDGTEQGAGPLGSASTGTQSAKGGLLIGGSMNTAYFNGTIDELAIWNRTLTASEVNALYQQGLSLMGLRTDAFRFTVLVNNTKPNLVNTSENATALDLVNELVRFNLSTFGFTGVDYNSVTIYNETGNQILFQINGSNITFSVNVTANASRQLTVYFDDDSLFGEKSQNVITDVDNLTETFFPSEKIYVMQYEKLRQLNASNYTHVRNTADTESSFHIKLADADTNATIIDYGGTVPARGNIVALQRYAIYQNSTAGVNNGRITIQVW